MKKYNKIFDFLSITHFLFFYIVGIYIKDNYEFAFFLGVFWEILEYFITSRKFTRNLLIKYWFVPKHIWDEDLNNKNRISDLIFNMLGYHYGNSIKVIKFKN